jgi:hypothetical protein
LKQNPPGDATVQASNGYLINGLAVVRAAYIILPVFIVFGLPSTLRRIT